MELDRKVRMLSRSINVVYYTIYLLTIVAVVTIFFLTYSDAEVNRIDPLSKLGTNISTAYIIFSADFNSRGTVFVSPLHTEIENRAGRICKIQQIQKSFFHSLVGGRSGTNFRSNSRVRSPFTIDDIHICHCRHRALFLQTFRVKDYPRFGFRC